MSLFTRRPRQQKLTRTTPAIEPLESRAYLSSALVVTFPGPLPTSEIAGVKVNKALAVNIANNGPDVLHGPFSITLFTSTDQTLSDDDALIVQRTIRGTAIGVGKNKTFKLNVKSYPLNLDNNYFILADVSPGNVVGASGSQVQILPPTIDLSDALPSIRGNGKIGHTFPVTVDVTNNGNVMAKGTLAVDFAESTSPTGSAPFDLRSLTKHIQIKPGKMQVLHFMLPLTLGSPSGNQFIVATVDPSDVFSDSDLSNNTNVSPNPVSIT